ncbi:MAG TPA: DUF362 domain-containing protein [Isosphaeraceae bacterium]|nr:DUF362 domain-containing protein [Isosphaeraceae bacterium]
MIDQPEVPTTKAPDAGRPALNRRAWLAGATVVASAWTGTNLYRDYDERGHRADVFIARATTYRDDLARIVREGLVELGFTRTQIRGKSVLLKPNLVEPSLEAPQINTHPALIRAVAEVFRRWDAGEVLVAEGQGHCRDSDLVLDQSGLGPVLDSERLSFVDLNHDDVYEVPNRLGFTNLRRLYLPTTLRRADLIVSLPKMKTHHWAGVTLSMKNLFGVMPGVVYGWPKNVLHIAGIPRSILDINAAVRPHLSIIDGIIGMEGDGPIMGTPRTSGVLVMGTNLPAVDATGARLMEIDPHRVSYLAAASGRLGPIAERHIIQRGEAIASTAQRFQLLDDPSLASLRAHTGSHSDGTKEREQGTGSRPKHHHF